MDRKGEDADLDELFQEWLESKKREMLQLLRKEGPMSASALATALNLSERAALSVIYRMAQQGTIKITEVKDTP